MVDTIELDEKQTAVTVKSITFRALGDQIDFSLKTFRHLNGKDFQVHQALNDLKESLNDLCKEDRIEAIHDMITDFLNHDSGWILKHMLEKKHFPAQLPSPASKTHVQTAQAICLGTCVRLHIIET